jgi:Flp pilus assembly protein TadG
MKVRSTQGGPRRSGSQESEGTGMAPKDEEQTKARHWRSRLRTLLVSEDEGTQLVEMALVAPLMMLMLTGIASFAMALYSYQQLGYATSTASQWVAAEYGMTSSDGSFDPCAAIVTEVTGALPNWSAAKFTYTLSITSGSGSSTSTTTFGPTAGSGFSCSSGYSDLSQNEPIVVTVSYAYNWFSIFTWRPDNSFTPSGNLTATEASLVQ